MQIDLSTKIRALRKRDGRTQEVLAEALGVSSQAVSRWESGGCYPDINLIPSIANYFGVTIDELFGYSDDRTQRIEALVTRIRELLRLNRGEDVNIDQCLTLARDAMIEFPGNEQIMLCLAKVLYIAGYVRHGEHHLTDDEGYSIYDTKRHREYAEWQEAIKLYEKALPSIAQGPLRRRTVDELSQLYVNMGYHEKAMALAEAAPDILGTQEFLKIYACDGKQQAKAYSEAALKFARVCAALLVNAVPSYGSNMSSEEKARSIRGAIGLFDQVCLDGNYGEHNIYLARMYMLLSVYLWLEGKRDETFEALDKALAHARSFEALCAGGSVNYTAPLLRLVEIHTGLNVQEARAFTADLPEDWPWWDVPEAEEVKRELEADPRWAAWVQKAREQ